MTMAMVDITHAQIGIAADSAVLAGTLELPDHARSVVVIIDGGASPLLSPRDARIAECLHDAGIGTLSLDLLTRDELIIDEKTRALRYDARMLAKRLIEVTDRLATQPATTGLPIGYFAGDTAAGAALIGAAARPRTVSAVVCRGGRPDLASAALSNVVAPTLLIVGGNDRATIPLNEWAFHRLSGRRELVLVENATHLYETAQALSEVCRLTGAWFSRYLAEQL
jgi:putative phosphoribosyl transferase